MSGIIVFAGTTEGRELSEWLCGEKIKHTICVATEYGGQVMQDVLDSSSGLGEYMNIHEGRLKEEDMEDLIRQEGAEVIVDATHPYAAEVTENIKVAAQKSGVRYIRLEREKGESLNGAIKGKVSVRNFADAAECAGGLKEVPGNILLTTGSKELAVFGAEEDLKGRLFARVLPGKESIALCEEAGLSGKQIIAMQGPFSKELNLAIIKQFDIACMVTKNSGKTGGFDEKIEAAKAAGIPVYIIGRPQETDGYSLNEVKEMLVPEGEKKVKISLIGCGMGNLKDMTRDAADALERAELVFGAERLLESLNVKAEKVPYYLAKDIIPCLKKWIQESSLAEAAVLFSGDTGFFSGARGLWNALKDETEAGLNAEVLIYPGISSISMLAAKAGINWDESRIISIHGRGSEEDWSGKLLDAARFNRTSFVLLSGLKDLKTVGKLLLENSLEHCRMICGYKMGSEDEEIAELTPEECETREKDGLYSIFIINERPEERVLSLSVPDDEFIRGKVPMTKEEVRTVSLSKLRLKPDSVFYDIGSGTGSVAVTAALLSPEIKVYAIERKPEAVELIKENIVKFGLKNVKVIPAYAPEGLEDLPAPTHAFIGGSGGKLKEILNVLSAKNPEIRVVINAVSFETLQEILEVPKQFSISDFEIVNIAVTHTREIAAYHMMQAANPVWICSFKGQAKCHSERSEES